MKMLILLTVGKMEILWPGFSPDSNHSLYTYLACFHGWMWVVSQPIELRPYSQQQTVSHQSICPEEGWRGNTQVPGGNWARCPPITRESCLLSPQPPCYGAGERSCRAPVLEREKRALCWGAAESGAEPPEKAGPGAETGAGAETEMGWQNYSADLLLHVWNLL